MVSWLWEKGKGESLERSQEAGGYICMFVQDSKATVTHFICHRHHDFVFCLLACFWNKIEFIKAEF